ncbi:hypothetical protein MNBD_ACTINO02-3144, partial [hydrothermal vent metagenome]
DSSLNISPFAYVLTTDIAIGHRFNRYAWCLFGAARVSPHVSTSHEVENLLLFMCTTIPAPRNFRPTPARGDHIILHDPCSLWWERESSKH